MKKQLVKKGKRVIESTFTANCPLWVEPVIVGTVVKDGETFYKCIKGKLYRPALFDKMFKVERTSIEHYSYKGLNINPALR